MSSAKLCPKCNTLPTIRLRRSGIKHLCAVNCPNIGCSFYYPIVITGFNKEKTMEKAITRWNETVEKYYK